MRRVLAATTLIVGLAIALEAQQIALPKKEGSVKFLVIGDSGTGGSAQQKIAGRIVAARKAFPFEFALMMGDNLYGSENPGDYQEKFEKPYKPLLDAGVKFYAALGNHDDPNQRLYKPFNMNGERYYSFKPSLLGDVRFFALDSNYMSKEQVALAREGAAGQRFTVEDCLLPPSDLFVRREARRATRPCANRSSRSSSSTASTSC